MDLTRNKQTCPSYTYAYNYSLGMVKSEAFDICTRLLEFVTPITLIASLLAKFYASGILLKNHTLIVGYMVYMRK